MFSCRKIIAIYIAKKKKKIFRGKEHQEAQCGCGRGWGQRTVRDKMTVAAGDGDRSYRVLHALHVITKILSFILGIK